MFFFQAEDGIRDIGVTGVQTCALPISGGAAGRGRRRAREGLRRRRGRDRPRGDRRAARAGRADLQPGGRPAPRPARRSEERRVGKEWRSRWVPYHLKKNTLTPTASYIT